MGVRWASVATTTIIASPSAGTEVIVATTGPINLAIDGAQVILLWYCSMTMGTNGTAMTALLRRGTLLTSTLINTNNGSVSVTAAAVGIHSGCYIDTPGNVAEVQYSLGIQALAATGASTVRDIALLAIVL